MQKRVFWIKSNSFQEFISKIDFMEKKLILKADKRLPWEKPQQLRKERIIPAVVYWKKQEVMNIKIDYSEFLKLYRVAWESKIVGLSVDWKNIDVLVYEVNKNPISWDFQHVDFFAITKWERVTTKIPLEFVWVAKASIEWAMIEEMFKEIEVRVLPKDLVDSFEVDITPLETVWDSIRISDLNIDREKFEILVDENAIVVTAIKMVEEKIEDDVVSEGTEEAGEEGAETEESEEEKSE